MEKEIISHLFYYCTYIRDIMNEVQASFTNCLHVFTVSNTDGHFGFHNINSDTFLIQNHILLLRKLHIHNSRKYGFLSFSGFLN